MKKLFSILVLLSVVAVFSFPGNGIAGALEDIKKSGELRIGVALEYPPVQFRDKNGDPVGFDIDVGAKVGQDM
jgi:ABC-type amino acid transport substrate-binding protein